jgi:hypothetical protein
MVQKQLLTLPEGTSKVALVSKLLLLLLLLLIPLEGKNEKEKGK